MRNKLARLLGLFFLTVIICGLIGGAVREGSSANCPPIVATNPVAPPWTIPNDKRADIYLNGIWQFIPAVGQSELKPPQQGWGSIWVPGDWRRQNNPNAPGAIALGTGNEWKDFDGNQLSKAWYQRTIDIPASFSGRAIALELTRVSTDAIVYVNGIQCGSINWPYGTVDITKAVKPGSSAVISLLVAAAADEQEKTVIMGPNEVYKTEAKLASRGLIGEVRLLSRPFGPHVSDIFVQSSTRQKTIKLDVELTDITRSGTVNLVAKMFDEKGKMERQFTATANVEAKPTQILQVAWDWPNPRLWDVGKPNLYNLRLEVSGSGIDDEFDQLFGFREFWIEGRKFYLNGSEIRLRPVLHDDMWKGWAVGVTEVADRMIDNYLWAGFNIAQLWPRNHDERGVWHFRELFADRADLKGLPLIGSSLDMGQLVTSKKWKQPEIRERWEQRMAIEMRRDRNHPSILIWGNSPNLFGYNDDQNPRRIGHKNIEGTLGEGEDKRMQSLFPLGEAVVATIKKYDPTRPVLVHQGAAVGDIYALNSYLNVIPLQEREEWLSDWTQHGDMPYMVVEFGTPLHATMMRGRNGFKNVVLSEPLMTEFSAIYQGKEAYQLETPDYRAKIRELFVKEQAYKSWHNEETLDFAPAFQKLQELFSTNTWRSWRTYGIAGGMIPWNDGHGWQVREAGREKVDIGPFNPGRRGPYLQQVSKRLLHYFQLEANIIQPGGLAIMQNNGPTLAWIAGQKSAFTAKDHSFRAGEKLPKQVVLINDTRAKQDFSFDWQVTVSGKKVANGQKTGSIESAQTLFFPVEVDLPNSIASEKVDGEILLNARIGNCQHRDRFSFRVFGQPSAKREAPKNRKPGKPKGRVLQKQSNPQSPIPNPQSPIQIFDPVGKTTRMLQQLGYATVPWDGSPNSRLLIIGREVLSGGQKLPGSLEAFVRNGGRAIVFTQNPEWMRSLGFRVSPHLTRRVFPIDDDRPVLKGLDEMDLRDWTGESTLVEAYPNTLNGGMKLSPYNHPWYGWHWGNRGAVSSASVEKPHRSGWRPILESEFDLAYTPLMELDYGKGRLIWNTLDLEDHVPQDAAAAKLARQIIEYGQTAILRPIGLKIILIGGDADAIALDALGLIYQKADSLVADAAVNIIGSGTNVSDAELRAYMNAGGKLFFMPRRSQEAVLGVRSRAVNNSLGSLSVPKWPETRGLSASDLRSRSYYDTWAMASGGEIAADGLLSRVASGKGVAIFSQIDPDALNADTNTYLRYTRWRYTRAIAQILANLGASFNSDSQFFQQVDSTKIGALVPTANQNSFYHPDYRTDFELGDDPYRYYRW